MVEEEKMEKFCPVCGSTNLKIVTTPWKVRGGASQERTCVDCGAEIMPLEGTEKFRREYLENLEKKKKGEEK